jgi:DNA-binding transcriptional MocR family regulator
LATAQAAEARKVEVTPLSTYSRRPMPRQGLQLGFVAVNAKEIKRGVQQLPLRWKNLPAGIDDSCYPRSVFTVYPVKYNRAR